MAATIVDCVGGGSFNFNDLRSPRTQGRGAERRWDAWPGDFAVAVAADFSVDTHTVLCALDRLRGRADFYPGMVAIHALQRALRIAAASGICGCGRDIGVHGRAIEAIAKDVAACGASGIARDWACELWVHLAGRADLLQRGGDQYAQPGLVGETSRGLAARAASGHDAADGSGRASRSLGAGGDSAEAHDQRGQSSRLDAAV